MASGTQADQSRRKGLRTQVDIYLSDVSRRWIRATEEAKRVLVLSPYLTQTAERILELPGARCDVYTVFQAENFVSGASSIKTLLKLQEHGCSLYHLRDLHAKIVLIPGQFASIGSQNVTSRGKKNKEATSVFAREGTVEAIEDLVEPWMDEALPITPEMLDEMNLAIQPLLSAMRRVQRACRKLDDKLWEEEKQRAAERDRVEKERQAEAARLKAEKERLDLLTGKVDAVKMRLNSLLEGDAGDKAYARELVAASTWRLTHPRGPVRAPRHQWNVGGSNGSWEITF